MATNIEKVQQLYVAYFNRPADVAGLNFWVGALAKGVTTDVIAAEFAKQTEYKNLFAGMTTESIINTVYVNMFGRTAEKAALDFYGPLVQNGTISIDKVVTDIVKGAQGTDGTAYKNKVTAATAFTVELDTAGNEAERLAYASGDTKVLTVAKNWLAGVTTDASLTASLATVAATADSLVVANTPAQTFTLTTGVDTFLGAVGNDTFNALPSATNTATLTALDNLDGGGGTDTLNVTDVGATGAATYTLSTSATIKSIEVLNLITASDNVGDTVTADVSAWTGLTTVNLTIAGTDAPVAALTTKGNVTAATVTGSTTAGITDSATTDTLATVTAVDATGLVTVTSDKLSTLNLTGSTGGATVVAAAGTRALTVGLNNVTAGTVTDAEATGLTINTTGAKSSGVTVTTAKAKAVTVNADESLTVTALNVAAATSLKVTGDSKVTVSAADFTALTSIDSSAQTAGGIDVKAIALGTGVAVTGGAGADSIQIGATTKAITLGAGNDRVLLAAATTGLGTDGSVDAGEGTNDILAFADADDATSVSAATTFEGVVAGFETIELAGAAGAAVTVNLANLDDAKNVVVSADLAQTLAVTNAVSGSNVTYSATQTGASSIGVANASTGTADVVSVTIGGAAAVTTNTLTIADVETINFLTDDTATTPTGIAHVSTLAAAAVKTITVAGDAGLNLTNTNTTVTSFDASGVTKGAVTWTTGILAAAATIKGGVGANTINFSAATKAVTYTGGEGVDTIVTNNAANTVTTGAGADVVTLGTGANTVDLGDGADAITLGAGLNVVTGGAGTDSFSLVGVAVTNGNTYSTIKDFAVGETIAFTDAGAYAGSATLGSKISLAATAAFADFLQAASAGTTAGEIEWFQYAGDTYIVNDASATAAYVNGTDQIIKLIGLVDLSASTTSAAGVVTFVAA